MGYFLEDDTAGQSLKKINGMMFIIATAILILGIYSYQYYARPPLKWVSMLELQHATTQIVFVDARDHASFMQYHIPGALPLPYNEKEMFFSQFLEASEKRNLEKGCKWVVYCEGGQCTKSHDVAQFLYENNFINVYILRGGIDSWQSLRLSKNVVPQRYS